MFYVFCDEVLMSAFLTAKEAANACQTSDRIGWYYITRQDANGKELLAIRKYEAAAKEAMDKVAEMRVMVNAHYRTLNIRFDVRERELLALGYKRVSITEHNMAVYTRTNNFGKRHSIAACTLSQADEIVWGETIAEAKRH